MTKKRVKGSKEAVFDKDVEKQVIDVVKAGKWVAIVSGNTDERKNLALSIFSTTKPNSSKADFIDIDIGGQTAKGIDKMILGGNLEDIIPDLKKCVLERLKRLPLRKGIPFDKVFIKELTKPIKRKFIKKKADSGKLKKKLETYNCEWSGRYSILTRGEDIYAAFETLESNDSAGIGKQLKYVDDLVGQKNIQSVIDKFPISSLFFSKKILFVNNLSCNTSTDCDAIKRINSFVFRHKKEFRGTFILGVETREQYDKMPDDFKGLFVPVMLDDGEEESPQIAKGIDRHKKLTPVMESIKDVFIHVSKGYTKTKIKNVNRVKYFKYINDIVKESKKRELNRGNGYQPSYIKKKLKDLFPDKTEQEQLRDVKGNK